VPAFLYFGKTVRLHTFEGLDWSDGALIPILLLHLYFTGVDRLHASVRLLAFGLLLGCFRGEWTGQLTEISVGGFDSFDRCVFRV
jgi:hypothetical protein